MNQRTAALALLALIALVAVSVPAGAARAQSSVVDEGSFVLTKGGTRVGREDFVIRRIRSSAPDMMQVSGTVAVGDRRLAPAMESDSDGVPIRYQLEERRGGQLEESLRAQFSRGRAIVHSRAKSGEATREFAVPDGALLLDDDVFAHYYFLARAGRAGGVPVVVPRRNALLTVRVEQRGRERLDIGGTAIQARELALVDAAGAQRRVWVDDRGRVLKVIDDRGLMAVREDPPR
ncbi:MAG: hypothetical protein ABJD07_01835 [Gemmatimonadaceae bacterium]